jgi:hypothetical protein
MNRIESRMGLALFRALDRNERSAASSENLTVDGVPE